MVAAVALVEGLTVLHHDGDFDLIADIADQPKEWVVPPDDLDREASQIATVPELTVQVEQEQDKEVTGQTRGAAD